MSDELIPQAASDVERQKLDRQALLVLLNDVTEQRDKILSQYEAMALQVDESTREIDDALLDAERNAKKAADSERRAEQEAARAIELSRQLDEERRKKAAITEELTRFRDTTEHAPVDDPWGVLWRAVSQILSDWVAWVRAKIPGDSPILPWFDRAVELVKKAGCITLKWGKAFFDWAKPHAIDLWNWLGSEFARRTSKE